MSSAHSLISELESSLSQGPSAGRSDMLRKVTALFLDGIDRYSPDQVGLFDDVISYLIQKIERAALIELSYVLAPIENAPANVIGRLARNDDAEIAEPVLEQSRVLTDDDLGEIASTKSQRHLFAISGRPQISEQITEILVERGDNDVTHKVTANHGASFSLSSLTKIAGKAEQDAALAAAIAARKDVPPQLFDELVLKATQAVRDRLLAETDAQSHPQIRNTLSRIARQVAIPYTPNGQARQTARGTKRDPRRLKADLVQLAREGRVPETISTLAALCEMPAQSIRKLVAEGEAEGILILGKFGGLAWPEIRLILAALLPEIAGSEDSDKRHFEKFIELSAGTAGRVVRFVRASRAATVEGVEKLL